MNPVLGLEISKEESHGQAFLDRGKLFRGTFHFEHTRDGLKILLQTIQDGRTSIRTSTYNNSGSNRALSKPRCSVP